GPLLALLLLDAAARHGGGRVPDRFEYRALSPLFVDEAFRLEGARAGGGRADPAAPGAADRRGLADPDGPAELHGATGASGVGLWVAGPRGLAMRADAGWDGAS
ncbi:MAG: hypothetical protein KY453_04960, partial [Gemmatimonadetes bacterium]|nr:hypothetical protein [Gemmatimonadota bacterium]